MISRRIFLAGVAPLAAPAQKPRISMGLEIYSLREQAQKDFPGTLALIRKLGMREVEVSGLYGHTAREFRSMLDANGIKATSMMAEHDRLLKDIDAVAADAHALGVEYVVCSTLPHRQKYFSTEDCADAAPHLNLWGERLARSGLHCCYHTHGTEFQKFEDGTVFDVLAKQTDPRYANFEMDIFWIVYGYQDPVKMLHRYPNRFPLMHVKDIRKGTRLGGIPADVREEDSVPLGQGIVNIPAALRAAKETGVRHFYIEDEAVDAAAQLPSSMRYVESLRL
jgi:sugar phosphate isomerase/epimerase